MKNDQLTPEQLAEQIVANSAALIQADLKLKASSQRSEQLMRRAENSPAQVRQPQVRQPDKRIFWLLLLTGLAALSYASYSYFSF